MRKSRQDCLFCSRLVLGGFDELVSLALPSTKCVVSDVSRQEVFGPSMHVLRLWQDELREGGRQQGQVFDDQVGGRTEGERICCSFEVDREFVEY